jgi:chemotaxis protein CheX
MPATLAPPSSTDTAVRTCVTNAVIATVERLCGSMPTLEDPCPQSTEDQQIIGIISFIGQTSWTLSWGFGERTAVALTRVFTGMDLDFSSADMGEVAAELVNVLAGDVVAQANQAGMQVQMSLPAVARGQAVEFVVDRGGPAFRLSFQSELGDFWICVRTQVSGVRMPGRQNGHN